MNYMTKHSIMQRLKVLYAKAENDSNQELFGIFLQGSQNYVEDLFFNDSDIDSRAIYIPNVSNICLGKDISKATLVLNNEEHIERLDIRKFLQLLKTPGINNYESLFTEYYIINPKYQVFYDNMVEFKSEIVRHNEKRFVMSVMGISKRDCEDLEKRSGGEINDIDFFGYSRKRLANIIRYNATVKAYLADKDFSECLKSLDQQIIHDIRKMEHYDLEQARLIAQKMDKETYKLASEFQGNKTLANLNELDKVIVELLVKSME